jgi:hypothetical protein
MGYGVIILGDDPYYPFELVLKITVLLFWPSILILVCVWKVSGIWGK